jgi:DNA-binding NarL/FixJ family response regulator
LQKESAKKTQVNETTPNNNVKSTRINPVIAYNFNKVKELQQQGVSKRAIADALKISRKTVARYISIRCALY